MRDLETAINDAWERRALPCPGVRRTLREQVGVSQSAVASAVGVSRSAISRYESGARTPTSEVLRRYGAVLERLAQETSSRRGEALSASRRGAIGIPAATTQNPQSAMQTTPGGRGRPQ